jgi:ribosomal protein L11 methyltransferase
LTKNRPAGSYLRSMSSYSLVCKVSPSQSDILIGILSLYGMNGCEERIAGDSVFITACFKKSPDLQKARESIKEFPEYLVVEEKSIEDQDWNAKWREQMKPAEIATGIWVSPTWLKPAMKKGDSWIKIEPKMAFGTGHHESTRLAAQAIINHQKNINDTTVLDIGTGSGVLCFIAGLCKAKRCVGIEVDQVCRENLAENLRDNPLQCRIDFLISDTRSIKKAARFDTVVANLIFPEAAPILNLINTLISPSGSFIWSGILLEGKDEAVSTASSAGFSLAREFVEHEWWCGVFRKSK